MHSDELKTTVHLLANIQKRLHELNQDNVVRRISDAANSYRDLFASVVYVQKDRREFLTSLLTPIERNVEALIKRKDELIAIERKQLPSQALELKLIQVMLNADRDALGAFNDIKAFADWESQASSSLFNAAHRRLHAIAAIMTRNAQITKRTQKEVVSSLKSLLVGLVPGLQTLVEIAGWVGIIESMITREEMDDIKVRSDWTELERLKQFDNDLSKWTETTHQLAAFFRGLLTVGANAPSR